MTEYHNLVIWGATGCVGSDLIKILLKEDIRVGKNKDKPIRVLGLTSKDYFTQNIKGLSKEEIMSFNRKNIKQNKFEKHKNLSHIVETIMYRFGDVYPDEKVTFVGASSCPSPDHFFSVLGYHNASLAIANKGPLADSEFNINKMLTKDPIRISYESTVMANAGVVHFFNIILDDTISNIEVLFSGTFGYVNTGLYNGLPFSESVLSAVDAGYTETNVEDDMNLKDFARKVIIGLRTANYNVGFESDSLIIDTGIPNSYFGQKDSMKFINSLKGKVDEYFKNETKKAKDQGKRFMFAGTIDFSTGQPITRIGPQAIPMTSELASLNGTENLFLAKRNYEDVAYRVYDAGAGGIKTARGLLQEVKYLSNFV
jgi:homoserine dehydrogenase